MASWTDGAEYAPTERPDGFATPRTAPLDQAPPPVPLARDRPLEPPTEFLPSAPAPALSSLGLPAGPSRASVCAKTSATSAPTARWAAAGLAAQRLIFAPRVDPARYRARLGLADLFLDTSPYNAGTIASDALRMGLPVLTMAGRAFASRMAASLLTAVGLTDCIASDIDDYVQRAIAFATDPERRPLHGVALSQVWDRTLGNAEDFTRRFERALETIVRRPLT